MSARKVRLVADNIRGLDISEALLNLTHSRKKAAGLFRKLLQTAASDADNNFGLDVEELKISAVTVDEGTRLKRWKPRARGRADRILKPSCHLRIELDSREDR